MNTKEQELTENELINVEAGCPHPSNNGSVNNPLIPDRIEEALESLLGVDL